MAINQIQQEQEKPKGPSALENAMKILNAGVGLAQIGNAAANIQTAFNPKQADQKSTVESPKTK